jgi:hypothetical protein
MAIILRSLPAFLTLLSVVQGRPHPSPRSIPTIPLNEVSSSGSSPLPSPTSKLVHIGLGLGTQNYTCNTTTGTYTSVGALARLFDATEYLTDHPNKVDSLPRNYLSLYQSIDCSKTPTSCIKTADKCEDKANQKFGNPLPILGEHYFTATGTPTFDLSQAPGHPFLFAKKVGDVPAPNAADVDWLFLASNGSASNKIISSVYRLETAGGQPPKSCKGSETAFVPYAAEYWFYA